MSSSPLSPPQNELEFSFCLPHSISRLWYIIRDINLTFLLCPDIFFPLVMRNGRDTWGVGTEFQCQTTSFTPFTGTCTKYRSFAQIKHLCWSIECPEIKKSFSYEYTLYKVTSTDSSVLLITIRGDDTAFLLKVELFMHRENFFRKVLERINLLMNESSLRLFQFEGAVIDSDMESIWKFLTHYDILKKIAPMIPLDGDCSSQSIPTAIGGEAVLYYDNHTRYVKVTTVKLDKRELWNKWVVMFAVKESQPVIPKYETLITVNKINEDECHVSWFNDFKEPAPYDFVQKLSFYKKYILKLIQDFLENYSHISKDDERGDKDCDIDGRISCGNKEK